jgi:pilus assembly protein Flp/PilA
MMTRINQIVIGWMKDEEGASMVEYALLVALIAAVCIGAVSSLGGGISKKFTDVLSQLTGSKS